MAVLLGLQRHRLSNPHHMQSMLDASQLLHGLAMQKLAADTTSLALRAGLQHSAASSYRAEILALASQPVHERPVR